MRVLVVEDDPDLADALVRRLRRQGHAVDWQNDGQAAAHVLGYQPFDLLLLDIGLPGLDGLTVLRQLRARGDKTPVLMLTARADIEDRVNALDVGADDYLDKPFDFRELDARCRALLRRPQGQASGTWRVGGLEIDSAARRASLAGTEIDLTNREFSLLEILVGRMGRVVSKDDIAGRLFSFDEDVGLNAVEVYVGRLRKKLGASPLRITTVRSLGYRADVEQDPDSGSPTAREHGAEPGTSHGSGQSGA
ncbi:two-component system response regulator TctD [Comamonas sp. BIGb0124]|uniref:response regulator transcription factor n=1 Tax=Comamonas sp. BIGb0124 TaxID=2485130 RepID=UPI000F48869B|nr:response regulator transcription factor [Comamonas sp. BIGb0124]ROR17078.1 two-component system response regulator TctD [Comamonas sp. BIGb0124]